MRIDVFRQVVLILESSEGAHRAIKLSCVSIAVRVILVGSSLFGLTFMGYHRTQDVATKKRVHFYSNKCENQIYRIFPNFSIHFYLISSKYIFMVDIYLLLKDL